MEGLPKNVEGLQKNMEGLQKKGFHRKRHLRGAALLLVFSPENNPVRFFEKIQNWKQI